MKKILIFLSLAFVVNFSFGQVLNNTFSMKVNAVAVVSSAAPNFTINLAVTDSQLKYSGNDVLVGDYFYAYVPTGKMHRFNITAVNSKAASVINVTVNDPTGTITVFPTAGVGIARQTSIGLIQEMANVTPPYQALIENHNKTLIANYSPNFIETAVNVTTNVPYKETTVSVDATSNDVELTLNAGHAVGDKVIVKRNDESNFLLTVKDGATVVATMVGKIYETFIKTSTGWVTGL